MKKKTKIIVKNNIPRLSDLFSHAVLVLTAIVIFELIQITIATHGPLMGKDGLFVIWIIIQTISGIIYAYISDLRLRKEVLLISQIFAIIGVLVLLLFKYDLWAPFILGAVFNPLPVARATLLDNYQKGRSTLKLVGITFLAQFGPWIFFSKIAIIEYNQLILSILALLIINAICTFFFFKDRYNPNRAQPYKTFIEVVKRPILNWTLAGLICAEISFYYFGSISEHAQGSEIWLSAASLSTVFGILLAMMYSRLPHLSIVTFSYAIGIATSIVSIYLCYSPLLSCSKILFGTLARYSIIGGLYLPLVADFVLRCFNSRHKAFGAALIEIGMTLARSIAFLFNIYTKFDAKIAIFVIGTFFGLAFICQRKVERTHEKSYAK